MFLPVTWEDAIETLKWYWKNRKKENNKEKVVDK